MLSHIIKFSTRVIILIICIFFYQESSAQQFPYQSSFDNTRHIWNPATIKSEGSKKVDLFMRQQWFGLGASKSPRYINASLQIPVEDYNMSFGGGIYNNAAGPVASTGVTLNYAYHLDAVFTKYGKLSLALSGTLNSIGFDPSDEFFNDEDDELLTGDQGSTFFPSVGGGIYYQSSNRKFQDNFFFIGASLFQAISTDVLIQRNNFERELHIFGLVGSNIAFLGGRVEPSLSVNLTDPEFVSFTLNGLYEMQDTFWAGLSYSTVSDVLIQLGIIIPNSANDSEIRLGMLGNMNIGTDLAKAGPGMEAYISYDFGR